MVGTADSALERLSRRADGRLELELKSIWKDGTRAVVFEPHDSIVRPCATVPAPRLHALRREVTPSPEPEPGLFAGSLTGKAFVLAAGDRFGVATLPLMLERAGRRRRSCARCSSAEGLRLLERV